MIVPFVYQTKPSNSLFEELKFIRDVFIYKWIYLHTFREIIQKYTHVC